MTLPMQAEFFKLWARTEAPPDALIVTQVQTVVTVEEMKLLFERQKRMDDVFEEMKLFFERQKRMDDVFEEIKLLFKDKRTTWILS